MKPPYRGGGVSCLRLSPRMLEVVLAAVVGLLLFWLYYELAQRGRYWARRGVPSLQPLPFFGNALLRRSSGWSLRQGCSPSEIYRDLLEAFPEEQIVGYYNLLMLPQLLVLGPEYLELVLIKDFGHFSDRTTLFQGCDDSTSIDSYQLFFMTGSRWRAFRHKLTPLFTSGKLKYMYQNYDIVGEKLLNYYETHSKRDVIMKNVMHLYSMDFAGQAIFGLNSSCLENPDTEYQRMGTHTFDAGFVKLALIMWFPRVYRLLGLSINNRASVKYFCKIIQDAFNYRKENNISRNDFIQMMMDLKEKGRIEIQKWDPDDDYLKEDGYSPKESFEITDFSLIAQAYTFMTFGLDAVAQNITYAFYELSLNQDIQDKARIEIMEQIKAHSGLTYEALSNMTYLGNIVSEVMRLYPTAQTLYRECTKDYTFPNGFKLEAGEHIVIPILAVHRNPNFFPEPNEFKPERFQHPVKPGTYLAFGHGPRMCIAMRFALLQVKYGLARTLSKYRVQLSPRTETPIKMKPFSIAFEQRQTFYFDLDEI